MTHMFNLNSYLEGHIARINQALDQRLPPETERPVILHQAMRYSVFAGGKRLRPVLCLAAAEAVGGLQDNALLPALALEILHTYTLIHDDLPCMDDDDLRRGRPTSHKVFGEANALLAGDALLTLAFEWLGQAEPPPPYRPAQLVSELAIAAGSRGVVGGQVEDLAAEGGDVDADRVDYIHRHKTGALLRASVRMGAMAAGATRPQLESLTRYGESIGLAFQIADDILNETSTAEQLGKAVGSDRERGKMTYVAVHGMDKAQADACRLVDEAIAALQTLPGDRQPLESLARFMTERRK